MHYPPYMSSGWRTRKLMACSLGSEKWRVVSVGYFCRMDASDYKTINHQFILIVYLIVFCFKGQRRISNKISFESLQNSLWHVRNFNSSQWQHYKSVKKSNIWQDLSQPLPWFKLFMTWSIFNVKKWQSGIVCKLKRPSLHPLPAWSSVCEQAITINPHRWSWCCYCSCRWRWC